MADTVWNIYGTYMMEEKYMQNFDRERNGSGSKNLQKAGIDRRIIPKLVRKGQDESILTGLMWSRMWLAGGLFDQLSNKLSSYIKAGYFLNSWETNEISRRTSLCAEFYCFSLASSHVIEGINLSRHLHLRPFLVRCASPCHWTINLSMWRIFIKYQYHQHNPWSFFWGASSPLCVE